MALKGHDRGLEAISFFGGADSRQAAATLGTLAGPLLGRVARHDGPGEHGTRGHQGGKDPDTKIILFLPECK